MSTTFLALSSDISNLKTCLLYAEELTSIFNSLNVHVASLKLMIPQLLENNSQALLSDAAKLALGTVKSSLDKKDVPLSLLVTALRVVLGRVMDYPVPLAAEQQPPVLPPQNNPPFVLRQLVSRPTRPTAAVPTQAPAGTLEEMCKLESALMREKERLVTETGAKMRQLKELVRANSDMSCPSQKNFCELVQKCTSLNEVVYSFLEDFVFSRVNHINECFSICFHICQK